jgi:hypothetical protein
MENKECPGGHCDVADFQRGKRLVGAVWKTKNARVGIATYTVRLLLVPDTCTTSNGKQRMPGRALRRWIVDREKRERHSPYGKQRMPRRALRLEPARDDAKPDNRKPDGKQRMPGRALRRALRGGGPTLT